MNKDTAKKEALDKKTKGCSHGVMLKHYLGERCPDCGYIKRSK